MTVKLLTGTGNTGLALAADATPDWPQFLLVEGSKFYLKPLKDMHPCSVIANTKFRGTALTQELT